MDVNLIDRYTHEIEYFLAKKNIFRIQLQNRQRAHTRIQISPFSNAIAAIFFHRIHTSDCFHVWVNGEMCCGYKYFVFGR